MCGFLEEAFWHDIKCGMNGGGSAQVLLGSAGMDKYLRCARARGRPQSVKDKLGMCSKLYLQLFLLS